MEEQKLFLGKRNDKLGPTWLNASFATLLITYVLLQFLKNVHGWAAVCLCSPPALPIPKLPSAEHEKLKQPYLLDKGVPEPINHVQIGQK